MGSLYTSSGDCRQKLPTEFLDQKESPLGAIPRAALEQVWLERQLELLLERATDDCKLAVSSSLMSQGLEALHLESELFPVEVSVYHFFAVVRIEIRKKFLSWERFITVFLQEQDCLNVGAVRERHAQLRPFVLFET